MMRIYIGIDWSEQKHDVTLLNEQGAILSTRPPADAMRKLAIPLCLWSSTIRILIRASASQNRGGTGGG
jgi:hypothetical protein